jgi:hypothetical protein
MIHPYQLYSLGKLYHEERLAEAQVRRLARKYGSRLSSVSLLLVMVAFAAVLLIAAGCTDPADPTVDTDVDSTDLTASDSLSSSTSASSSSWDDSSASASSDSSTNSVSQSASASPSSSSSSSASADASASASSSASTGTEASRYAGMRSSTSIECYTFYSDGTVELRHGGTSTVSDSGSYQGDQDFGEIVWDSGRWTSTVVAEGDGLIIDDLKVSPVESCF